MYVIAIYDIADKKVYQEKDNSRKIRKQFEKYLKRVNYSVFEGELSAAEYKSLFEYTKKHANQKLDSVVFYLFSSLQYSRRESIGEDKISEGFIT
jgi:CRISPR-associated endonuclease Cas2